MSNKIIKDLITLKKDFLEEVSECLPDTAKEKINRVEYEIMTVLHGISEEYLEKARKPKEENKEVKKVNVE
jgi:predicted house-cleaning noncanonical NTP pyrophosphatase (MazG superfamily)